MNVPLHIASRYLFARGQKGVVHRMSAVSVGGMALGTAALIVILSVYNGFDGMVRDAAVRDLPDYVLRASEGKTFCVSDSSLSALRALPGVLTAETVLEDRVYVTCGDAGTVVSARGLKEAAGVVASRGLLVSLKVSNVRDSLTLIYPDRKASFNPMHPSIRSIGVRPRAVSGSADNVVVMPLSDLSGLLGYGPCDVTGVEIRCTSGFKASSAADLFPGCRALDRDAQQPDLYRMLRSEKLVITLLLFFVVVIVAFNLVSCLSMLRIGKRDDAMTLRFLGLDTDGTRRVFFYEGLLITALGLAVGLVVGLLVVRLQSATGFVRMPGVGVLSDAYPVRLMPGDVLLSVGGVAAIGVLASLSVVLGSRASRQSDL